MGDVHLDMVGYVGWRALQKVCQTVLHHLHEENGLVGGGVLDHTQELDNVGVFQVSQDLALLLKSRDEVRESRVLGVHDDSMEDFSSTWLFIQCCLHHITIGSRAQDLDCVDHHILIAIQTAEAQRYVIGILGLDRKATIIESRPSGWNCQLYFTLYNTWLNLLDAMGIYISIK